MYGVKAGNDLCPFCRKPTANTHDEEVQRCTKRMEAGDADAFGCMGTLYLLGGYGLPQDIDKGLELTERAAELGSAGAHYNLADLYFAGQHVPRNAKNELSHNQQAAMRGHIGARHNLGCGEMKSGHSDRAIKHWMIASASGSKHCLHKIQLMFTQGTVTKAQYEKALRTYQSYQEEIQSDQRTRALEFLRAHNQTNDHG